MTELIWEGKYDRDGRKIAPLRVALPFQTVETVNESAQERQRTLDLFSTGRDPDWRNRLIWGDKKYALPALLQEFAGKVDLVYIDPPFDTGADFSLQVHVDGEEFTKEPSIIEQKAYRDTWGRGLDSYLQWFYETAVLLRDLLAETGSLYVHCDWHVGHYMKVVLDDVFGRDQHVNEVIWYYKTGGLPEKLGFGRKHDTLFFYAKDSTKTTWNGQKEKAHRHFWCCKRGDLWQNSWRIWSRQLVSSQEFTHMHLVRLFPHLGGLRLRQLVIEAECLTLVVMPSRRTAACPKCQRRSSRLHSHYERTLADLPLGTRPVRLRLQARRFRCANPRCARRIFTERFPDLVRTRGRRTEAQRLALEDYGREAGGAGGARLAQRRRLEGSGSTILRLVRARPVSSQPTPRVLGVDDWARRRGQTYGTILVDLERHHVVDLLEDRTASTLATWLRAHPGVEVITRDRAGAYAEGARQGAPNATQIADRYHLAANVGEVFERILSRKRGVLKETAARVRPPTVVSEPAPPSSPEAEGTRDGVAEPSRKVQAQRTHRAARLERFEAVIALDRQGLTQKEIARQVGIGTKTVRRFLRADAFPERAPVPRKGSILNSYEPYLRKRWEAGCHNALQLWREVQAQGFPGAASLLRKFVARWRSAPGRRGPPSRSARVGTVPSPIPPAPFPVPSPRQARWLLLRNPEKLRSEERTYREILLNRDPEIAAARTLAADFGRLIKERDGAALAPWVKRATGSVFPEFRAFVTILDRDRAAVEAALALEWSNGQTEGQINRLKLAKRQTYGRGSLALLKARLLTAA